MAADLNFYFESQPQWNRAIPTPESTLGWQVGQWHVRHDQLLHYMHRLSEASDRVQLTEIGQTHEQRPLVQLTISSPENLARIDAIREAHLALAEGKGDVADMPVVIWLGYSVHGNEPSGSNASLLVAYYLAAAEGLDDLLDNAVIILDPSLNPDGLSRYANYVNSFRGMQLVDDVQNMEHQEPWPRGRTNHYFFDLNRDWLLLVHPESRARIRRFHEWRPNILTDHHEMGSSQTFFFQPGIPSRQNPITPMKNLDLTREIAGYHANFFDEQGQLYFSEESFDDFYYGKGSTYPDIQGSIGILFEQGSARGHLHENSYGGISFPQAIKNQVTASLSTMEAGKNMRAKLLGWQKENFLEARKLAKRDGRKAFVFGSSKDAFSVWKMASVLRQHQIELHRLAGSLEIDGETIRDGYVVLLDQNQYRLIKSVFDPMTTFNDNSFYDVSSWHFPSAFGVRYKALDKLANLVGDKVEKPNFPAGTFHGGDDDLAYLFRWEDSLAPRAAYRLAKAGVRMRFAMRPFQSEVNGKTMSFSQGTIAIPMGLQELPREKVVAALKQAAAKDALQVYGIGTGLTPGGPDLGSGSFRELKLPQVGLLAGNGTTSYAVGELWHLMDNRMDMEVSLIRGEHLQFFDLSRYSHLVMPSGSYGNLDGKDLEVLKAWLQQGGVLVGFRDAVNVLKDKQLVNVEFKKPELKNEPRLPYGDRSANRALQRIAGTTFRANVDVTHPLGFGYGSGDIAMFRTNTLFMDLDKNPYANIVQYTGEPLISGYVSKENLEVIKNSAAMISQRNERGLVVVMADAPNFRGFWQATNRLYLNTLFFGQSLTGGR